MKANDLTGSPNKLNSVEKEEQLKRDQGRLAAYGFTHLQNDNTRSLDRINSS